MSTDKERICCGGITVFFALLLALLLSLTCTILESARYAGLSYFMAQAQEAALESVFAGYYRPLKERYHLLFMADAANFENRMEDYLSYYEDIQKGSRESGVNLYRFETAQTEITGVVTAADNGGTAFLDAVCEDMERHSAEKLSESLRGQEDLLKQVGRYAVRISRYADSRTLAERARTAAEETESLSTELEEQLETLSAAGGWKESGILTLVLGDLSKVSEKYTAADSYPSDCSETVEADPGTKAAAALYAAEHFGYFGKTKEDCVLDYELEYILAGGKSDRENLSAVAEHLLMVRLGLNALYLRQDGEKMAEIKTTAAVLAGLTGNPGTAKAAEAVLFGLWAAGEAVYDVQSLLDEGEVPLIKTAEDWKLSLWNAAELLAGKETVHGKVAEGDSTWDYEGYLLMLFLTGDMQRQTFRMMDIIELNLRQEDKAFYMENCIFHAEAKTKFLADTGFLRLPFVGNEKMNGKQYVLRKKAVYEY